MRWMVEGTGLEAEPVEIEQILSYRHSRFHALQGCGPMVQFIPSDAEPDDLPLWAFADEIYLDAEDIDPERGRWSPVDNAHSSAVWG
jgi:hypothetical protein